VIDAVIFDLDDTLFLQEQWLAGAWAAVADCASGHGGDGPRLEAALVRIAAEGSAAGGIIDRALDESDQGTVPVAPLVATFRTHRADRLDPLPGAAAGLQRLRARVPLALVSDGDVGIQRGKLAALGLADVFDVIIWSDSFGRAYRKPHPRPFLAALDGLGTTAEATVYVGDNPAKDIAGAAEVGMRAVRVRTGEYADVPGPEAWIDVADVAAAAAALAELIAPGVGSPA
jgi:putative hydrolase of the HAD superfamily